MKKLFLILALLFQLPFTAEAAFKYMDPDCTNGITTYNPTGNGGTGSCTGGSATVYSAMGFAIPNTFAGDTLYVRGGTYNIRMNSNSIAFRSGTSWANAPVFAGFPGETVIFKPTSTGAGILNVATSSASPNLQYQIWQDMIFDGSNGFMSGQGPTNGESNVAYGFGDGGTSGPDAHHIRFIRVTSRNNQSGDPKVVSAVGNGFQIGGGGFNECLECTAHNNGNFTDPDGKAGYGFYIGGSDNILADSDVFNNGGYAVHQYGSGVTNFHRNKIYGNRIWGNNTHATDLTANIIISSGNDNEAFNNQIRDGLVGIQIANSCASGCKAYSNYIYGASMAGLYPEGKGELINNIVENSVDAFLDGGWPGTPTLTNNACWNNSDNTDCTFTSLNPRPVDPANNDFRLCEGKADPHPNCGAASQVIDVGFTLGSPWNVDRVGTTRPIGAAYDLGPHESGVTSPSPSPDPILVAEISCDSEVTDSSGNGNDGSLTNGATYDPSGKYNEACSFDGVNDSVTLADSATIDTITHGFTISAWVKMASILHDSVVIARNPDSKFVLFAAFSGICGTNAYVAVYSEGSGNAIACNSTALVVGTWYYLTATYNRTALKLYKDANLITTASGSAVLSPTSGTLQIGNSGFSEPLHGLVDNIRIYNYPRNDLAGTGTCDDAGENVKSEIQCDMDTPINAVTPPPAVPMFSLGSAGAKIGSGGLKIQKSE